MTKGFDEADNVPYLNKPNKLGRGLGYNHNRGNTNDVRAHRINNLPHSSINWGRRLPITIEYTPTKRAKSQQAQESKSTKSSDEGFGRRQ